MRTSDPQENFLTVMKTGEFGIFRESMGLQALEERLGELTLTEIGDYPAGGAYLDNLTVYFAKDDGSRLLKIRIKLDGWSDTLSWYAGAEVEWVAWLSQQSFEKIFSIISASGLPFRIIRHEDQSLDIVSRNADSEVALAFYDSLRLSYLDVDYSFEPFDDVKSIEYFNS